MGLLTRGVRRKPPANGRSPDNDRTPVVKFSTPPGHSARASPSPARPAPTTRPGRGAFIFSHMEIANARGHGPATTPPPGCDSPALILHYLIP